MIETSHFRNFLIASFSISNVVTLGEDRWLCTLMVQAGWRLEYCAAAENFTYVPDNFDEFYKQRRRWIPSTLANLALLISESEITTKNNDSMSFPFILYQAANVFSTLIRFVGYFMATRAGFVNCACYLL